MEFSNAKKGAKIIFIAVILQILSEAFQDVALAVGIGAYNWQSDLMMTFSYIGRIFAVATFVATLWGIGCAQKDEPYFKKALIFAAIAIPVDVVAHFLRIKGTYLAGSAITTAVSDWIECIIVMLICFGFAKVYERKQSDQAEAKRREWVSAGLIFVVIYVIAKGFEVAIASDQAYSWGWTIIIILLVADVVLSSVAFIKMLISLKKAAKEL